MGKKKRMGMSLMLGAGMVVAGPVIAGCAGTSHADWAATEGAIGRINMDAVQDAFKKSKSIEAFEKRLNQIYEGDGIVLVRAKEEGGKRTIEAFEDLNNDREINPSQDDLLFTITNENNANQLRGQGANSYHTSFAGTGNFLFTYLIFSSLTRGGYGYVTTPSRVPDMAAKRDAYRDSPAYAGGPGGGGQVSKNTEYYRKENAYYRGGRYTSAGRQLSPARRSYLGTQKSSGAFNNSNTGVRAGFGKYGGKSGFFGSAKGFFGGKGGGASGGGGAQVIIRRGR